MNRKDNRLKSFDYSQNGAYFITICTKDMECILSEISADESKNVGADDLGSPFVNLTEYGKFVRDNIIIMNDIYSNIKAVSFVVMPNHLHILLSIQNESILNNGAPRSSPPTNTLSKYVTALKKFTSKQIGYNIWQRSYYDHIIRNEEDYINHLQYIDENPRKWLIGKDEYYI